MRKTEMQVKLLFPTREIAEHYYRQLVYLACRTCYSELKPEEIWERIQNGKVRDEKMEELITKVVASGHHSTIEHIWFAFSISGVSRTLSHQLVRHRIGIAFDQQSQRYVQFKNTSDIFVEPDTIAENPEAHAVFEDLRLKCAEAYQKLVELGIPAEDARFVFPQAVTTNLIMTVNLRELIHICGLRLCTLAQWEIRSLFKKVRKEVMAVSPFFGRMLVPHCVHEGFCNELNNQDGHCRIRPPLTKAIEIYEKWRRGELVEVKEPVAASPLPQSVEDSGS
jgi:thymidylate synthase (FAD)